MNEIAKTWRFGRSLKDITENAQRFVDAVVGNCDYGGKSVTVEDKKGRDWERGRELDCPDVVGYAIY